MNLPSDEEIERFLSTVKDQFAYEHIQAGMVKAIIWMRDTYAKPLAKENEKLKGDYVIRDFENEIHRLKAALDVAMEAFKKVKVRHSVGRHQRRHRSDCQEYQTPSSFSDICVCDYLDNKEALEKIESILKGEVK